MEEAGWKKDEKPYLIFTCSKCKQYLYVKTLQKTKKCLRCGRQHKVSSIINSGEIVKGMTKAVEMVKTLQNELAIKEIGNTPELRTADDYVVRSKKIDREYSEIFETHSIDENDDELEKVFRKMIHEISESYDKFPFYVLEIMAENYAIPSSELRLLVKNSLKEGFLILLPDNSYRTKL